MYPVKPAAHEVVSYRKFRTMLRGKGISKGGSGWILAGLIPCVVTVVTWDDVELFRVYTDRDGRNVWILEKF